MKTYFGKLFRALSNKRTFRIQPQMPFSTYQKIGSRHTITVCPVAHVASAAFYRNLDRYIDNSDLALLEGIGLPLEVNPILSAEYATSAAPLNRTLNYQDLAYKTDLEMQSIRLESPNARLADIILDSDNQGPLSKAFSALGLVVDPEEVITQSLIKIFSQQRFFETPWAGSDLVRVGLGLLILNSGKMYRKIRHQHSEIHHWLFRVRHQILFKEIQRALLDQRARNIVIVYGALHLPDIDKRLRRRGWRPTSTRWFSLW